eukprot:gnl/MRDRNA2_/MRDRNA2_129275_c0_seq1.p1 gnl/MRDRNA2_/MRDRNA2_129275_c0~~gnl/MRDRNA2_/MRDRNA2_129275_c0_seq1.p1  ORF type:complete len:155 (+),score=20.06 gnl/MRDRNA2_/MRDRNA2_129275_c0_seq1:80-544(+)
MDTVQNILWCQRVEKEMRLNQRWSEERDQRLKEKGRELPVAKPPPKRVSSAMNFLDQTLGLSPSPFVQQERAQTPELLRHGVSSDGQGRGAYLKRQSFKLPQQRYGRTVTSNQEVGWTAPNVTRPGASPFANKPLIQNTFFRSCGANVMSSPQL